MIRIGYACVNTSLPSASRSCRLSSATDGRLLELARQNLDALFAILRWNRRHGIGLFRISSETIPFASHPVNTLPWWDILAPEFARIGAFIRRHGMRVSMHPGQYTVLNSLRPEVVQNSMAELLYHARFLDALGLGRSHRIVVHLGGTYGDAQKSRLRFERTVQRLPERVRRRLVLENDEKSYPVADVLEAGERLGLPVVFDVFHHACLPSLPELGIGRIVALAARTWRRSDGPPKLHYSQQWPGKPVGAHSQSVDPASFRKFYDWIRGQRLDVMLEVKDKEKSVLRLLRAIPELRPEGPPG